MDAITVNARHIFMIETEEESSDLDSSLKIEYGIRSYVVSDGGAVSRTSPEMRDDARAER